MKFYAASNHYGSESSIGFSNTWYVRVFDSRKARDEYVQTARDLATRAITRKEVIRYASCDGAHPTPFTPEYWGIVDGYVEVVAPHDIRFQSSEPARFYS